MNGQDEIQALRESGDFCEALRKLLTVLNENTPDDTRRNHVWQRHMDGRQCLLLESVRQGRNSPGETVRDAGAARRLA